MILLAAKSPIILLCFSKSAFRVDLFTGILLPWKLSLHSPPERTSFCTYFRHRSDRILTGNGCLSAKCCLFCPLNSCLIILVFM